MRRGLWVANLLACVASIVALGSVAHAGTIIKLNLGGDNSTDISYDGTSLSTLNDGDAASPGDQDTAVDFLDILSPLPDLPSPQASFSLNGLAKSSPLATVINGLVIQNFSGGTLKLYGPGPAYDLLLSGSLNNSALAGPLGAPATGAVFLDGHAGFCAGAF